MSIDDDEFTSGVQSAARHLCSILKMPEGFEERDRLKMALTTEMEPHHIRGICGAEFQILAESALEKMYNDTPEEQRLGAKYMRSEREFIENGGANLRNAKEYAEKEGGGKAPRKAMGVKKTISKKAV